MNDLQNEYVDFLKSETIKANKNLDEKIKASAKKYVSPDWASLLPKYSLLFFSSTFVSLLVCPQMGVGLRDQYPLFHHFFHTNQVLCAIYCAWIFFMSTHFLVYLSFNRFEKIVLTRKLKSLPILLFSLSFGGFMFLGNDLVSQTFVFTWAISILALYGLFSSIERKRLVPNKMASVS